MADTHIHEKLDKIDIVTVILYRVCFILLALSLLSYGASVAKIDFALLPSNLNWLLIICFLTLLQSNCMHLYNKKIRTSLIFASIIGIGLASFSQLNSLALGASLFTLCGLSIKEYYCFRIQMIKITPLFLILQWGLISYVAKSNTTHIFSFLQDVSFSQILLIIVSFLNALLLVGIGVAKLKQPLDFDIGDKSNYQL